MDKYELTVILPGKASAAKKKTFTGKLEKLVEIAKGEVGKSEDWGEIELSYKIKKEGTGVFLHFNLELLRSEVKKVEEKLRLDADVLRHLLVRKEN